MHLDRRQLFVAGGSLLASCATRAGSPAAQTTRLDELLLAHADALPEHAGSGANHYPMAAEALVAFGRADAIEPSWVSDASLYAGTAGRAGPIVSDADIAAAFGDYERFGDWLALFRSELEREPWRAVVRRWAPRLAPAVSAAAFHGVIRTAHAVRALQRGETPARRNELAVGLAYWASRWVELPTTDDVPADGDLAHTLADLEHPWLDDRTDVDFFAVNARMAERPLAPPADVDGVGDPAVELAAIVRDATAAFLEMLVLERHRIWLLHTVTGPAAVEPLLAEVDEAGARALVAHARQAVVAMYAAYGEPHVARAHVRPSPAPWPELVGRVVDTRSVHGIKLTEVLARFDRGDDTLWRSVAEQWLEWT